MTKIDILLQIWDLAGDPEPSEIRPSFVHGASVALLFYSVNDPRSFEKLDIWINYVREHSETLKVVVLLGNKSDLEDTIPQHQVLAKIEQFKQILGKEILFFRSSSLSPQHVLSESTKKLISAMNIKASNAGPKYIFKIILLGELGVGKTMFRQRYLGQQFSSEYTAVLGSDFEGKTIEVDLDPLQDSSRSLQQEIRSTENEVLSSSEVQQESFTPSNIEPLPEPQPEPSPVPPPPPSVAAPAASRSIAPGGPSLEKPSLDESPKGGGDPNLGAASGGPSLGGFEPPSEKEKEVQEPQKGIPPGMGGGGAPTLMSGIASGGPNLSATPPAGGGKTVSSDDKPFHPSMQNAELKAAVAKRAEKQDEEEVVSSGDEISPLPDPSAFLTNLEKAPVKDKEVEEVPTSAMEEDKRSSTDEGINIPSPISETAPTTKVSMKEAEAPIVPSEEEKITPEEEQERITSQLQDIIDARKAAKEQGKAEEVMEDDGIAPPSPEPKAATQMPADPLADLDFDDMEALDAEIVPEASSRGMKNKPSRRRARKQSLRDIVPEELYEEAEEEESMEEEMDEFMDIASDMDLEAIDDGASKKMDTAESDMTLTSDLKAEEEYEFVTEKVKQVGIDYYDRMVPAKHYKMEITISTQTIEKKRKKVTVMTGERQARVIEEITVAADADFIRIVPMFPGCLVTPAEHIVDVTDEDQNVQFYVTPLVHGKIQEAIVQFWSQGKLIGTILTPTKVINPWISRVIALGGMVASTLPKLAATGLGLKDLPTLIIFNQSVDLLLFLIFPGVGVSLTAALLYKRFTRPRKTISTDTENKVFSA